MTEPCSAPATASQPTELSTVERWVRRFQEARVFLTDRGIAVRSVGRGFPPRYFVTFHPGAATREDVLDLATRLGWLE